MSKNRHPAGRGTFELFFREMVVLASLALSACATNLPTNEPLVRLPARSYHFDAWITSQKTVRKEERERATSDDERKSIEKSHENLVVMSFSGGGTRAAALAAAVLEQLGEHRNRVAIISSTSGGSVTAGFVAAEGTGSLSQFEERFLRYDNTKDLTPRLFPLYFTGGNRSQVFARQLDERLFASGLNFGELAARWDQNRPFVVLNASDMSSGHNFVFTQESFGALCSDLSTYPLSEAIAASAAVPVAMSPITLANHWDKTNCALRADSSYDEYYRQAYVRRHTNLPDFISARYLHSLRHAYEPESAAGTDQEPYRRPQFVHLLDGGLSDNLASRALLRTFGGETIPRLRAIGVKRILLVQVNAKSDGPDDDLDRSSDSPGIWKMFKTAVLNPIDVTTALSAFLGKEYWAQLVAYDRARTPDVEEKLSFFPVEVDFDLMDRKSLDLQRRVKAVPTWWTLSDSQLEDVKKAGRELLSTHPCFLAFREEAKTEAIPGTAKCGFIQVSRIEGSGPIGMLPAAPPLPPAAAPAKPAPAPAAAPKPAAQKVTLAADALFDFNKADLRPEGKAKLDKLAADMKAIKLEVILAVGHADRFGDDAYNQKLSEKRAAAVKAYLVSKGVEANRVYAEGKGEKQPVTKPDQCKGPKSKKVVDCLQPDRRVDIEVIGTK